MEQIDFDKLGEPVTYRNAATGETQTITNPYPEWQRSTGESCCWNCYRLLWTYAQVKRHLCDACHQRAQALGWEVAP